MQRIEHVRVPGDLIVPDPVVELAVDRTAPQVHIGIGRIHGSGPIAILALHDIDHFTHVLAGLQGNRVAGEAVIIGKPGHEEMAPAPVEIDTRGHQGAVHGAVPPARMGNVFLVTCAVPVDTA